MIAKLDAWWPESYRITSLSSRGNYRVAPTVTYL